MRTAKALAGFLLLALITTISLSQDVRGSVVRGVVVRVGSDAPLARINVELQNISGGDGTTLATTTNEKGEFSFAVPPGRYRLAVSGAGYVKEADGQTGLAGTGIFSLAPSQEKNDIRIALTPTAAISGRIVDPSGAPLINADVVAFQESYSSGQRGLTVIRAVRTNDFGEYRIFWLRPGPYYIGAQAPEGIVTTTIQNNPNGTDTTSIFGVRRTTRPVTVSPAGMRLDQKGANLFTYFPGTFEGQMAQLIDAQVGSDIRNIDFIVRRIDTYRVHGNVLGAPAGGTVQVRLLRSVQPPLQQYTASTNPATGAFEIPGVVPGPYSLLATAPGGLSGRLNLEVRAANVDVTVSLRPDLNIPIRIRREGQTEGALNLEGLRVDVVTDPWVNTAFSVRRSVPAMGTLTANLPAGDYRVYVSPVLSQQSNDTVPQSLRSIYVKSIQLDGIDVLSSGLHLERQREGTLEIVLGLTSGTIFGVVLNEGQMPMAGATVVLLPGSATPWFRHDMHRVAPADESGHFRLENVVPGDYRILALNDVEQNAWLNPEFLKIYSALPVHVDEDTNMETNVIVSRKLR